MQFQRQSLPSLTSNCYQSNNPECELKISTLFQLIKQNQIDAEQENITLTGLFKLLKIWKLDIPYSMLARLFQLANRLCNQQLNQMVNIHSFHQLIHNPQLQTIYRKKPKSEIIQLQGANAYLQNCLFSTPQTLVGLFTRLGELIQRKQLYYHACNENMDLKERYNYIIKMMQVSTPREQKIVSPRDNYTDKLDSLCQNNILHSTQSKVDSQILQEEKEEEEDNFPTLVKPGKPKFQLLSHFIDSNNKQLKANSRMRKMHQTMMNHMELMKNNQNVNKINKLIQHTQGYFQIKLPEI